MSAVIADDKSRDDANPLSVSALIVGGEFTCTRLAALATAEGVVVRTVEVESVVRAFFSISL